MSRRDVQDLLGMIHRFVDGNERTQSLAAEIEGLALECFQEEPWFDEMSEALALFVPGGTAPYLDEAGLARELAPVAAALSTALKDTADDAYPPDGSE